MKFVCPTLDERLSKVKSPDTYILTEISRDLANYSREVIRIKLNTLYNLRKNLTDSLSILYDLRGNLEGYIKDCVEYNLDYGLIRDILWVEILNALEIQEEFNIPIYRELLRQAVYSSVRYWSISKSRSGGFTVFINFGVVAGNTRDYINAVNKTREWLRKGKQGMPAISGGVPKEKSVVRPGYRVTSSSFFYDKLYAVARRGASAYVMRKGKRVDLTGEYTQKYWATIAKRVENFTTIAPFWELINYGQAAYTDKGFGDSIATELIPTHFISKAERRLENILIETYFEGLNTYRKHIETVEFYYQQMLENINELINRLEEELKKKPPPGGKLDPLQYVLAKQQLYQLAQIANKANINMRKIENLARLIASGGNVPARARLGGDFRPRLIELVKRVRGL